MSKSAQRDKHRERLTELFNSISEEQHNADIAKEAIHIAHQYIAKCEDQAKALSKLQAEPVKHGEWIDHGTTCQRYECSVCGDQHDWLILPNNINFCPNCGAKMDKGGDTE